MRPTKRSNLKLGLFVLTGIAIFIFAIYYIGSQSNRFGGSFRISGVFRDVSGLKVGNNVRFAGINIGTVAHVQIINDSLVQVDVSVQKDVRRFIRTDSRMEIGSEGLMGNKLINISAGSPNTEIVRDGDILKTVEVVQIDLILKELDQSSKNTTVITRNLADITEKINQGEGIFGKLFTDTSFSNNLERISSSTAQLTANFAFIADKLSKEEGALGKLLTDTLFANQIDEFGKNIEMSSKNLTEITSKINQGEGVFGKIFTDTTFSSNINVSSKNLNYTTERTKEIADNLEEITHQLGEGKGLLNKLLTDTAFADSVEVAVYNINKGAKEVDEAAQIVKNNRLLRLFSKKDKKKK